MPYQSTHRAVTLALAGDVMLSRRLTPFQEPAYLALKQLLRGADASFANLETVVRHPHEGHPSFSLGTPMTTAPELLADLKWLGLNLLSIANNHASDYGTTGVQAMVAHLQSQGWVAAGAGNHLAQARAPRYIDTAAGRIGLVAATSFFKPWNAASDQRPDALGRPGINPLGFKTSYHVDQRTFEALAKMAEALGLAAEKRRHARQFYSAAELGHQSADKLSLFGHDFVRGSEFSVQTSVVKHDADSNLKAIAEARRQCDWVIFSFHSHEFGDDQRLTAQSDTELTQPGAFAQEFSRAAIEAGADVVAGHGHHVTLGTEIHRGRPIFYGLGNFVFQNDTVEQFPSEAYKRFGLGHEATPADFLDARTQEDRRGFPSEAEFWEGAVAQVVFDQNALQKVLLHPIDLGFGCRRSERGRPLLASGAKADRALARLARLNAKVGSHSTRVGDALQIELTHKHA